jgi:hypothetical protein
LTLHCCRHALLICIDRLLPSGLRFQFRAFAEDVLERDFFMSAPEAREFGIVDEVIEQRPAGEAEALLGGAGTGTGGKLF